MQRMTNGSVVVEQIVLDRGHGPRPQLRVTYVSGHLYNGWIRGGGYYDSPDDLAQRGGLDLSTLVPMEK